MIKKRGGFSYVLVTIIVTIMISLVTMLYVSTNQSLETSVLYTEYSNNYYMAVSGIETLEREFNYYLYENIEHLLLKTDEYILNQNLNDILFLDSGDFYFKMKDRTNQIGEKNVYYKLVLFSRFYTMFKNDYSNTFSYKLKNEFGEYLLTVNYVIEGYDISVTSEAKNLINDTSLKVAATIKLDDGYEKIEPIFKWSTVVAPFYYAVSCSKLIVDEYSSYDGELIENYSYDLQNYFNNSIENNILISDNIDIGTLDDNYYVVFSNGDLLVENTGNNKFKGVIVSAGDINFVDFNAEIVGNIIAKNNINLLNSNIKFVKESDAIFKVNYKNNNMYFDILDALQITNFKNYSGVVDNSNDIKNALNNAQFDKIKSTTVEKLQFKTTELRKLD